MLNFDYELSYFALSVLDVQLFSKLSPVATYLFVDWFYVGRGCTKMKPKWE